MTADLQHRRPLRVAALALAAAAAVGAALGRSTEVGSGLGSLLLVGAAGAASPVLLAGATVAAAVLTPALAYTGLVPPAVKYADVPLAWATLASGLVHAVMRGPVTPLARRLSAGLAGLGLVAAVSWALNGGELLRPIAYTLLLGQPFALVAGVLAARPSPQARDGLLGLVVGLALLQVPLAVYQASTRGLSDPVQGTLLGKGAGAHLAGGLTFLVAVWLLGGGRARLLTLLGGIGLLLVPFLSDAKQVLLAGGVAWVGVFVLRRQGHGVLRKLLPVAAGVGVVWATVALYPAGRTALGFLETARSGRWGKLVVARKIVEGFRDTPVGLAFGLGPGQTVSRLSFLALDAQEKEQTPLRALAPSEFFREADISARIYGGGPTSFNSAQSSLLGLLGDLGIAGLAAYAWLTVTVARAAIARGREGTVVLVGWVMLLALGFVFDWLEEPPFTVPLAALTASVLASRVPARLGALQSSSAGHASPRADGPPGAQRAPARRTDQTPAARPT